MVKYFHSRHEALGSNPRNLPNRPPPQKKSIKTKCCLTCPISLCSFLFGNGMEMNPEQPFLDELHSRPNFVLLLKCVYAAAFTGHSSEVSGTGWERFQMQFPSQCPWGLDLLFVGRNGHVFGEANFTPCIFSAHWFFPLVELTCHLSLTLYQSLLWLPGIFWWTTL